MSTHYISKHEQNVSHCPGSRFEEKKMMPIRWTITGCYQVGKISIEIKILTWTLSETAAIFDEVRLCKMLGSL